ncbi:MAG: ABC transporter permease [Ardenticatenaceae bacterium]|nr:ABC transporter permease [Ardenticatenaceae bacterium]
MTVAKIDLEKLQEEAMALDKPEPILVTYWKRLRRHTLAVVSLFTLIAIVLGVIFGPIIMNQMTYFNVQKGEYVNYGRDIQDLASQNASPSAEHWLGTDELGRDVLYRLLIAGRLSLTISFAVVLMRETFGTFLGSVSGYYGGKTDTFIQRLTEFIIVLPSLPILLTLASITREIRIPIIPAEWTQAVIIIVILSALGWTGSCRLSRAMVLSLRNQEFTEASRALGMSNLQIIIRHMIPNTLAPIIVSATLGLGGVILVESALSFLGFGINPPVATWGNMLQDVQTDMLTAPWKAFFPGFFILTSVLAFNYLGDGLRDALDPRLKL